MDVQELLAQAKDAMTVKRVFGEPYERDGVTLVPVAAVAGGGGGGTGEGSDGEGSGSGFGLSARPVGVYVIKNEQVSWEPALDLNRIVVAAQFAAIVLLLTLRTLVKSRGKTKRAKLRLK